MRGASKYLCRVVLPVWIIPAAGLMLLLLATIQPSNSLADTGISVIPLKHRLPDELIIALQPHLEPGERITAYDTRLILQASPQRRSHLKNLIEQMDTAHRNLRITVRQGKNRDTTDQQQGVSGVWQKDQTRIVINNETRANPGDATIQRDGEHGHVTLRTHRTTSTSGSRSDLSLLVHDGGYAMLRVGVSLPQVQPYLQLAGQRLAALATAHVYDVTTGFDVWPRMQGDRTHLKINPRLEFRTDQGNQVIQFTELQTEIVVRPGEWVDLGGLVEHSNDVNRQILASRDQRAAEDSRLMVRIDPL
jgi:type II secretory pathway component GspD/PulD (secretin)